MRRTLWIILFLLCVPAGVGATTVSAIVDRNQITPGESINLQVSILNGQGAVEVDNIQDFKVLSRGTNTSVQIINGQTSRTITYNYTLLPVKTGTLQIPPLAVKTDDQTLHTKPITIQVAQDAKDQAAKRDIFVESQLSRSNPFVGEQISYVFRLFNAVQITNARFQPPSFDGFTSQELEKRSNYRKVINGREYAVAEVIYILVPMAAGPQKIEAAVLQCDVVRKRRGSNRPRSFFDDRFFGRTALEPRVLSTEPLGLDIRPLPEYQGPVPFSGLVGRFEFSAQIEPATLNVGDSATLTLTLQGTGNIMDAAAPDIDLADSFKVYTDNPEEQITVDRTGFSGQKIFRAAIVPIEPGEHILPSFSLSFFDVALEKYVIRTTPEQRLSVKPAAHSESTEVVQGPESEPVSLKQRVEFTGRDILPLKQELSALNSHKSMPLVVFSLLIIGPALIFGLVKLALTRARKQEAPSERMASRARVALKDASAANLSVDVFLNCLYRALTSAIFARAGTTGESLTWKEAQDVLTETGYDLAEAQQTAALLEKIESSSYSGASLNNADRSALLARTQDVIRTLLK